MVRANYNNLKKGIHATTNYLELFFENLLMDTDHELKNRYLHVDYEVTDEEKNANKTISKCKNCTLDCTLEELAEERIYSKGKWQAQRTMGDSC